ncbi:MAG: MJ0042-type zinc finger domain-containing protein [Candidatus Thorarchaeota archaeon]
MCPHCRAAYRYTDEKIRENGTVICQDCAKVFRQNEKCAPAGLTSSL